jgi:hypothetical protein
MTLIGPKREIMKILGHPRTFLEAWNEGAMEYWETGLCCASPKKSMPPSKAKYISFPGDRYSTTPLLHQRSIDFRQSQLTLSTLKARGFARQNNNKRKGLC